MSFSNMVKLEITANKPLRLRYKTAQAYGLLLYAKSFSREEVSLHTGSRESAELYAWFVRSLAGKGAEVSIREMRESARQDGTLLHVGVPRQKDRDKLLSVLGHTGEGINQAVLPSAEHVHAFLAGAWLACGNITDPEKGYHVEFVCKNHALCGPLRGLLEGCIRGVGQTARRGAQVLYVKEVNEIEDLLTLMGASKASLAMIEVEMIKGVRNKANRVTNCETANIDKTVSASAAQVADIRMILETKGEDWLPEALRQTALLRLQNPELSLRELAEASPDPISRSGMHHRLEKLSRLAEAIRENRGGKGHV